jgi:hypothetical protein
MTFRSLIQFENMKPLGGIHWLGDHRLQTNDAPATKLRFGLPSWICRGAKMENAPAHLIFGVMSDLLQQRDARAGLGGNRLPAFCDMRLAL